MKEQMQEVCKNCVHCHKTKELIDSKWVEYYVCTLWLDLKEKHEPLLMTLGTRVDRPNVDLCECIQLKEQKGAENESSD